MKAGHEFIVTTDDKFAQSSDDKVLYVDYVRFLPFLLGSVSDESCLLEKLAEGHRTGQTYLR